MSICEIIMQHTFYYVLFLNSCTMWYVRFKLSSNLMDKHVYKFDKRYVLWVISYDMSNFKWHVLIYKCEYAYRDWDIYQWNIFFALLKIDIWFALSGRVWFITIKKKLFMIPGITDKTCKYIFGKTSYVILFIWRIALLWFPMFWGKVKPLVSTPFYRSCFYICLSICVFLCSFPLFKMMNPI